MDHEDATSAIKVFVNHYIPHHGFPALIRFDNGTDYNNEPLKMLNRTLKDKLAKIGSTIGLHWLQALPLALLAVRQFIKRVLFFL